jgi:hypothetical protein
VTDTQTLTLADFLLARIAEDEEAAREVGPYLLRSSQRTSIAHADRWHPTRVLAECQAKRRIVGRLAAAERAAKGATTEYAEGYDHGILDAARFLALPYADHPDYCEEWSVSASRD